MLPPEFQSPRKIMYSMAAAISVKFNPRNLEAPFYSCFMLSMFYLLDNIPLTGHNELIVAPQSVLYVPDQKWQDQVTNYTKDLYIKSQGKENMTPDKMPGILDEQNTHMDIDTNFLENDTDDEDEDTDNDDNNINIKVQENDNVLEYDDSIQNLSFGSNVTGETVPDSKGLHLIPDLIVNHARASEKEQIRTKGGKLETVLKLDHLCISIILENKPSPSRQLSKEQFQNIIKACFLRAYMQLALYAAVYFQQNPDAPYVILIAAAGPWWQWMKVTKDILPSPVFLDMLRTEKKNNNPYGDQITNLNHTEQQLIQNHFEFIFASQKYYHLGTQKSDKAWTQIRNTELIPLIEACNNLPPVSTPEVFASPVVSAPPAPAHISYTDHNNLGGKKEGSHIHEASGDESDDMGPEMFPTPNTDGVMIQFLGPNRRLYKFV